MTENMEIYIALTVILERMRLHKETVAKDKARFLAACVTDAEHVWAYFRTFVLTTEEIDKLFAQEIKH